MMLGWNGKDRVLFYSRKAADREEQYTAAFDLPQKWEVGAQNDIILNLRAIELQNGGTRTDASMFVFC